VDDLLDLDAITPKTLPVKLGGKTYDVIMGSSLPVGAAFDAARLSKAEDIGAILDFLDRWCKLPREALETLSKDQLNALLARLMPRPAGGAVDPPRTAEGIPGTLLGAEPCRLP
jgi:hypothetical protein